ncbi:MAG: hypothetical protein U0263_15435 [Polyangiaceae bacterium]
MTDYRDSDEAAKLRAHVLQEELAEREAEVAAQRQELERQRAELAAKSEELAALRARVPEPAAPQPDGKWVCGACHRANEAHYKFCLGCGREFGDQALPVSESLGDPVDAERNRGGSPSAALVASFVVAAVVLAGVVWWFASTAR